MDERFARYARQVIFPGVGEDGQARLAEARVTIIGVGATGSVLANHLARAGVGHLRLVDRDFLELNNLQRQLLYDEDDVAALLPKAVAAARRLRRINSAIAIEDVVADANASNIESLIADADVVLDGTDNFSTRYLINDACVKRGTPWVYTGVLAAYGMSMTVRPGTTACLRCIMGEIPAPGSVPTCDTAGIVGPIVALLGSYSAAEAIKLLVGKGTLNPGMVYVDLWENTLDHFELAGPRPDCPTCGGHEYPFLQAETGARTTVLCGRDAVQVSVAGAAGLDLATLAERLRKASVGEVQSNAYLLRARLDPYEVTVFPDGRAVVKGTSDESVAATVYARYVGM